MSGRKKSACVCFLVAPIGRWAPGADRSFSVELYFFFASPLASLIVFVHIYIYTRASGLPTSNGLRNDKAQKNNVEFIFTSNESL